MAVQHHQYLVLRRTPGRGQTLPQAPGRVARNPHRLYFGKPTTWRHDPGERYTQPATREITVGTRWFHRLEDARTTDHHLAIRGGHADLSHLVLPPLTHVDPRQVVEEGTGLHDFRQSKCLWMRHRAE